MEAATSGIETAQKNYEKLFGSTKEQVEKASATAFKTYEDFSKFSKENVEAYVVAGSTVFKGFETISRAWVSFAQETFDASAQVAKAMLTAKTLREAVDVQTDFAKTTFDKLVSEGTKVSELSVKVANEAAEPISARLNATIEKFLKPVAA
jgi:phasin family protein